MMGSGAASGWNVFYFSEEAGSGYDRSFENYLRTRQERLGPPETMDKDLERDYSMSSEEAVEYGLIDKILRPSSPEKPGTGADSVHIASGLLDG